MMRFTANRLVSGPARNALRCHIYSAALLSACVAFLCPISILGFRPALGGAARLRSRAAEQGSTLEVDQFGAPLDRAAFVVRLAVDERDRGANLYHSGGPRPG